MRIQITMEGGFAGLSRSDTIDTSTLSPKEASELEGLIRSARFFEQPARANAPPAGAADYRQYTITIEDGGRRHTVVATDPINDAALQSLVRQVQAHAKAQRAAGR